MANPYKVIYLVGNYRLLTRIVDEQLIILVVAIDHQSSVYS